MKKRGPTLDEARRGIYLDFEGPADAPPAVLGTLWVSRQGQEPMLRQYVVDGALRPLATPPLAWASLAGELRSLIGRAERQQRVLIGWSGHELRVVETYCPELADTFATHYRDAKVAAKRWARSQPDLRLMKDARKRKHRLAAYEGAIGLERLEAFGPKGAARAIRGARKALEAGVEVEGKRLARWERMLAHNELDCRGTRAVALTVLEDPERIDATDRAGGSRKRSKRSKRSRAHG